MTPSNIIMPDLIRHPEQQAMAFVALDAGSSPA